MFELSVYGAVLYSLLFTLTYYVGVCIYTRSIVRLEVAKIAYYVSIFCTFGVAGEVLVNNVYTLFFHTPLWEYHLFPAHGGDVSYFFVFIWGTLGVYKYINDITLHRFTPSQHVLPGIVMGAEAMVLEVLYNGLFLFLFGSYIFYYLPSNLGPLSHLSCLEVVPFYFIVGICITKLIQCQERVGYTRSLYITLPFYWMIIISIVFFG
jgi:hypothetical protein